MLEARVFCDCPKRLHVLRNLDIDGEGNRQSAGDARMLSQEVDFRKSTSFPMRQHSKVNPPPWRLKKNSRTNPG